LQRVRIYFCIFNALMVLCAKNRGITNALDKDIRVANADEVHQALNGDKLCFSDHSSPGWLDRLERSNLLHWA